MCSEHLDFFSLIENDSTRKDWQRLRLSYEKFYSGSTVIHTYSLDENVIIPFCHIYVHTCMREETCD